MDFRKAKYLLVLPLLFLVLYFLLQVFSGALILPQAFLLGPIKIHYYGIIMATAVGAGFWLAVKRSPSFSIIPKQAEDLIFWVVIGGFIGARVYHVLSAASYYYIHPGDIIKVWNGGLSIYGAVLGGFCALLFVPKFLNLKSSILNLLDWLTPSLILGQIIGRFGNLFNYEAFGYPTNLAWKMFVPFEFRPQAFQNSNFFHPFFLYEAMGCAFILFFLLKILKTKAPGGLFFFYLLLYNALRFGLEFLRIDSTFLGQFRLNSIVSLLLIIIAIGWLYIFNRPKIKTY